MNIHNLEAFTHVAWFGSFSKAAEMLYLTQPSISSRIQSLERELGVLLFDRIGRTAVLTEIGKVYLPYAEAIVKTYHESKLALWRIAEGSETELVIASALSLCTYFLPPVLTAFREKYPRVSIKIKTGQAHDILDMVLQKRAHLGLTRSISHPKINQRRLFSDPLLLTVYPEHPFASRGSVTLEEVSRDSLLLFDQGSADWSLIYGMFQTEGITPNISMNVESIHAVKELVVSQMGISFLPTLAIKNELEQGKLIYIPIHDAHPLKRQIDLIELAETKSIPTTQLFKEMASEHGKHINIRLS